MNASDVSALRARLKWTQRQLADSLKLSAGEVRAIERGTVPITTIVAQALEQLASQRHPVAEPRNLKMELDFKGLIRILAGHLYSKKEIFVREMIQNSHDAIWRRHHADPTFDVGQGRIDIMTDLSSGPGRIVFRDNGVGMTEAHLIAFLAAIGRSGTQSERDNAPEVIGQFGIGFLSGFVVSDRIEVRTRHYASTPANGCLWVSNGDQAYSLVAATLDHVGTEVTIHLKDATDRAVMQEDTLRRLITTYADMLRVAIHINDPQHIRPPVNMRVMPWEREGVSQNELRLDNMIYLEKRVPDNVLEVIPVNEPDVQGLLYISRTRVIGRDTPRTVRVFLKRMFLCEGADELLPRWASFVNGLLNTTILEPNAARDKYMEDDNFVRLREKLGTLVISHLEGLRTSDPRRLSEILAYHHFGVKAACHYYDEFFDKFSHLLEWRVNPGSPLVAGSADGVRVGAEWQQRDKWLTLPDLMKLVPSPRDGGPKRVTCFTSASSASQYFEMADAAKTTVIDASGPFEDDLLKAWAKEHESEVTFVHVDRQDDPAVFRDVDPDADGAVINLAQFISANMLAGQARVRVEPRRFSPKSVTSVLRETERTTGVQKATSLLRDPDASAELKKMAEDLLRMTRNSDVRMFINADNDLVRALASLVSNDPGNHDALEISLGLYNSAILSNARGMDPENAKIFSGQYQRLMQRVMALAGQAAQLQQREEEVTRREAASLPQRHADRNHLQGFYVTSFDPSFDQIRQIVRTIIEQEFRCELLSANHRKLKPWISQNVHNHIASADFFVVDLSHPISLNVLIEAGAIGYARSECPVLYIAGVDRIGDKPNLPADLEGLIVYPYARATTVAEMRAPLAAGIKTDTMFEVLRERSQRDKFISADILGTWTKGAISSPEARSELSKRFPTLTAWHRSEVMEIEQVLRPFGLDAFGQVIRGLVIDVSE